MRRLRTRSVRGSGFVRRPNYGALEIEVRVDDPKSYTRPWTVKVTQRLAVDTELNEFICEDRDAPHYVGAKK